MKFNIVSNEGERTSVTVFIGSDMLVATKEHSNFTAICEYLAELNQRFGTNIPADDVEKLRDLFDVGIAIGKKFDLVSDRVSINNGRVFLDLMPVDTTITRAILRFQAEQHDFMPLVLFMEKLESNPNAHSKEHLFRWLRDRDFSLCPDGDFIAYKGVNGHNAETFRSVNSGPAVVNGEQQNGKIPNRPGTVIEMPRGDVTFDPAHGCSAGLHVGTWSYASTFVSGGSTLQVKVNPRDVVSVPTDCHDQKARVCRYRVVKVVQQEDTAALVPLRNLKTVKVTIQEELERKVEKAAAAAKVKGAAPAKKQKVVVTEFPEYYEQFNVKHWNACTVAELRAIALDWEISPIPKVKGDLIKKLNAEGRKRRRTW